jgi:hypothetical protein
VLPDAKKCQALLAAMKEAGAPGASVFDSQGQELLSWYGAHPALSRLCALDGADRETGKAILAVVPDTLVDAVVNAADRVLDGFSAPYSGMLCTWRIGRFRCYQGDKPPKSVAAWNAERIEARV